MQTIVMTLRGSIAALALLAAGSLAQAQSGDAQRYAQAAPAPAAAPAAPSSPWTRLAPFPEPAEEVLGATANGKLYVFAGLAPGWKPIGMVYEYDPAANKWTKKNPMPLASHHVAITTLNNKIYAFGGFVLPASGPGSWIPIDNAWEYDPAADTWKALAPLPMKRGAAGLAAVNGKLYLVGGSGLLPNAKDPGLHPTRAQNILARVDEYDPATNSWKEKSPMITPRNHHVVQAVGNKLYAIGGRIGSTFISGGSNNIDLVEEYDPAADSWASPKAKMPTPRSAAASGVHNGKIYIAGGEMQNNQMFAAYKTVEAYDPASNSWAVLPPMQFPRHGLAAGVLGDRFHTVSGDVQSAGNGGHVHVEYHDALTLAPATR